MVYRSTQLICISDIYLCVNCQVDNMLTYKYKRHSRGFYLLPKKVYPAFLMLISSSGLKYLGIIIHGLVCAKKDKKLK